MVKLSKEAKQRLQQLFKGGQFAIRWGFIPLVIYLGQWEKNLGGDRREGDAELRLHFWLWWGEGNVTTLCRFFEAVRSSGVGLTVPVPFTFFLVCNKSSNPSYSVFTSVKWRRRSFQGCWES